MNERLAALKILQLILQGKSLTEALANFDFQQLNAALIKEMCFGVLRWYEYLESQLTPLLNKPLKDVELKLWLILGLYQLCFMQEPAYAVVSEMVSGAVALKKPWAKG